MPCQATIITTDIRVSVLQAGTAAVLALTVKSRALSHLSAVQHGSHDTPMGLHVIAINTA